MKSILLLILISVNLYCSEVMDLGNLDIKGNLDLPSYSLKSNILTLDSSLKKIVKLDYRKNFSVVSDRESSEKLKTNKMLIDQNSYRFDINIQKVRLD